MLLYGWIIGLLFLLVSQSQVTTEEAPLPIQLLEGSDQPRPMPIDLGTDVHQCRGDIKKCPVGFTVDFWFKPDQGDHLVPHRYLISSGGQSAMSEGFYMRQNYGKEYEAGVARGGVLWRLTTELAVDWKSQLALAWDEGTGLDLFVDGILAVSTTSGDERVFTKPMHDPFPNIFVGNANDDISNGVVKYLAIWNVTWTDIKIGDNQVSNRLGGVDQDYFSRGCAPPKPSDIDDEDLTSSTSKYECRSHCAKHGAAVLKEDACSCWPRKHLDNTSPGGCTVNSESLLMRATHALPPGKYPIGLKVDMVKPTVNNYVRPNETVTFVTTTDAADEAVTFYVDFDDGERRVTTDTRVSHAWLHEGEYTVNTTALTRVGREEVLKQVDIEWVEEGMAPELVVVESNIFNDSREVMLFITAISVYSKKCVISTGDGQTKVFKDKQEVIFTEKVKHVYEIVGFYSLSVNCSNAYGHTSAVGQAIAMHSTVDYTYQGRDADVAVDVVGSRGRLVVSVNQVPITNYHIEERSVTIPRSEFQYSGEHIVTLSTTNGRPIYRKVFNLQTTISQLQVVAVPQHTQVNKSVDLSFQIAVGDHISVWLRYGDGDQEYLYFANESAPIVINRQHSYQQLGVYKVVITAANDIGSSHASQLVSIERIIKDVNFTVVGVVRLGAPSVFTFIVDPNISPAMPIEVELDYHDQAANEIVQLGVKRTEFMPLTHKYAFEDYGWYDVWAIIRNNISKVVLTVDIQVGQDIDYVDVYADKQRAVVGEEVTFTIIVPRGSPIKLEMDMGDGSNPKVLYLPEESIHNWFSDRVEESKDNPSQKEANEVGDVKEDDSDVQDDQETGDNSTYEAVAEEENVEGEDGDDSMKDANGGTQEGLLRRKRALPPPGELAEKIITSTSTDNAILMSTIITTESSEIETATDGHTESAPEPGLIYDLTGRAYHDNTPFKITYKYTTPGTYMVGVTVTNQFTIRKTTYCPRMVIVAKDHAKPKCPVVEVSILDAATQQNATVLLRSQSIDMKTTSKIKCSESGSFRPRYTWQAERKTEGGQWRPELNVCETESSSDVMTVNRNNLWYGLYRFSAVVVVHASGEVPVRKKRDADRGITVVHSDPAVTYVLVTSSPLVAHIAGDQKVDVSRYWPLNVDIRGSHDPDVETGNTTGIIFYLFCYRLSIAGEMRQKALEELIEVSYQVTNSSQNDVRVYGYGPCFAASPAITILGLEVIFKADHLLQTESVVFRLIVTKDERSASVTQEVKVWPSNSTGMNPDAIDDLLASGNVGAALVVMSELTDSLNTGNQGNDSSASAARTELRGKVINLLGQACTMANTFDQMRAASQVLNGVTMVKTEVTIEAKTTAANALGKVGNKTLGLAANAKLEQVTGMGGDVLAAASNLLPFPEVDEDNAPASQDAETDQQSDQPTAVVSSLKATNPTNKTEPTPEPPQPPCCERVAGLCEWLPLSFECLTNETVMDELDNVDPKDSNWTDVACDEIHPDSLSIYIDYYDCYLLYLKELDYAEKASTSLAWTASEQIGSVMHSKMTDNGEPLSLDAGVIKIKLTKFGSEEARRRKRRRKRALNQPDAADCQSSVFASMAGTGGGLKQFDSPNMRTFSDTAKDVRSNVLSLSLADKTGGDVVVQGLSEHNRMPINIILDEKKAPKGREFMLLLNSSMTSDMNYHPVNVTNQNRSIVFKLIPDSPDDSYEVFFAYNGYPNETYYDWRVTIPVETPNVGPCDSNANLPRYTVTLPASITTKRGVYRFGIKLNNTKLSIDEISKTKNYTYTFAQMVTACLFWKDDTKEWVTAGCVPGPLTTFASIACLCNHLTSFGGDMVVPPNTIDFNTVFSLENFLESMPVFCTVIVLIIIYAAFVVWGRRQDKKDLIKWGATPLEDNLPTDEYHYQITVYTGINKSSGTRSRISFILSGDDGDTGVRRLFDGKRKELEQGSINNYVLSTEACLGPLSFLRLWHDNKGKGTKKGWMLGQVQLMDLQTGEKFFFLCNRWLAVEEDDGAVERILPVAGLDDLTTFSHLFQTSMRKKLTNDHMWVSVLSRPTRSNFTRVQRVSCCVSLLFLTMITNCMFFRTEDKTNTVSAINIGPFSFTLAQLFISVVTTLIVFPPSIAIVMLFRKARPKRNTVMQENQQRSKKFSWRHTQGGSSLWANVQRTRTQRLRDTIRNIVTFHQKAKYEKENELGDNKPKRKSAFTLPHWTIYLAWTLVFFSVVASGFFTILYSMEWGRKKSVEWLQTFLLSFFQSVIVVQPVKVLLFAAFVSCVLRKPDLDEDEENFDDINASPVDAAMKHGSQRDLQDIILQRKMAASQVAPPDTEALAKAREIRLNEVQMEAILKECLVYFSFIMVLFFLSYQAKDPDSFLFSQNIKNTFFWTSTPFDNVKKPAVFWSWVHAIILPNLYSGAWYNGQRLNWNEALQIDDRNTIRVGVARFRQLRIKEDTCKIQNVFGAIFNHCRDDYNWLDDDTKDYLPGWKQPLFVHNSTKTREVKRSKRSSWIYRNTLETKTAPYSGTITMYKGGGYTFNFRRSPRRTVQLLKQLEELEWVSPNSRAVFIEFTLYNANVNLFASVIMLVEFMATGSAVSRTEVKVFRLSSYVGGFGVIVILFELIFLVFTVYFMLRMVKMVRKERMKYFKNFWNLLEVATIVMSLVTIGMYAAKKLFGSMAMNVLHESESGDYVNFVPISIWDEMFGFLLAMVVFVSTLKFIKMLRFNRRMSMLGDTIKLATKELKIFSITFFIYYFAFCMMAYLLFGKLLPSYGTFAGTVEALFAFALGDFDFHAMESAHSIMGPIFFFMYVMIIYVALMGMFLTIIAEAFTAVKANSDMQSNEYEIVDFMVKKLRGVFGWT